MVTGEQQGHGSGLVLNSVQVQSVERTHLHRHVEWDEVYSQLSSHPSVQKALVCSGIDEGGEGQGAVLPRQSGLQQSTGVRIIRDTTRSINSHYDRAGLFPGRRGH